MLSSLVVILVTVGLFFFRAFTKPASVLAVDLTGGTSIVYSLDNEKKPAVSDIRKVLDSFDNATIIQYQEGVGATTLLVKTGFTAESVQDKSIKDVGGHVTKLLQDAFKDAKLELVSVDEIGSMVGADLKRSGTWAVILSLCAILIYVGVRFEFGFGLGAIVALAHDALITLGIFSLCGRQVSLIVVTALLTIIGYSVNDTIVIFDRIREDLRKNNKLTFAELCNNSLNSCLSRTVITSLTTLFAVLALFAFGDGSIFDFAFTMLLGIIAGTYSTMFIATPIMMWFYKNRRPEFKDEESSED
jgi:preprotein translocase SecF subunit